MKGIAGFVWKGFSALCSREAERQQTQRKREIHSQTDLSARLMPNARHQASCSILRVLMVGNWLNRKERRDLGECGQYKYSNLVQSEISESSSVI